MKKTGILFLIALFPVFLRGQCFSSEKRPAWMDEPSIDLTNSYIKTASASGYSEAEARNKAIAQIIGEQGLGTGARFSVDYGSGGAISVSGKDALTVKAALKDEYRELCDNGQHRVTVLVQVARNPTFELERADVTTKYPFSPSVFVPGMRQIQKGSITKGVVFIGGEILLVGGGIVCEMMRSNAISKIGNTHNAAEINGYYNDADTWKLARNISFFGAGALYIWNIIDGTVAKGKKHLEIGGRTTLSMTPYASPLSSGLALNLKF